jgi:hypothetical protein
MFLLMFRSLWHKYILIDKKVKHYSNIFYTYYAKTQVFSYIFIDSSFTFDSDNISTRFDI